MVLVMAEGLTADPAPGAARRSRPSAGSPSSYGRVLVSRRDPTARLGTVAGPLEQITISVRAAVMVEGLVFWFNRSGIISLAQEVSITPTNSRRCHFFPIAQSATKVTTRTSRSIDSPPLAWPIRPFAEDAHE